MSTLTRRRLLNLCAGGAAVGLAGCSGGGDGEDGDAASSEPLRIGELAVTNFDANPHTIHVVFFDGEDPVYWRSREVPSAEDGPEDVVLEGYPTEPGGQVLHVRLDDQSPSEWARFDFDESDASCLGLHVRIGDFGEERGDDLSIWTSDNQRDCEG